jgi:redox-sensing transcriptional repressor
MRPDQRPIPGGVIERLPTYLNALVQLRQDGLSTVSSSQLGAMTGVNPAQLRRDLGHLGYLGRRGVGYDVGTLVSTIQRFLGSDHTNRLVLVGAGSLGSAIARYRGLRNHGFIVTAVFDSDPRKVGSRIGDVIVRHVDELERAVADQRIRIGVLAVPPESAQDVADRLVQAGIQLILNYAPVMVQVPEPVLLHNSDPVQELLHTLYYLSRPDGMAATQDPVLS